MPWPTLRSPSASTTAWTWRYVARLAQQRIIEAHQHAGVTMVDPASTLIETGVRIGADTTIEPSTFLRGSTRIGARGHRSGR